MQHIFEILKGYEPSKDYIPFSIVCEMSTPIMLGAPFINSDSLIMYFLLKKLLKDEFYNLPSKQPIDFTPYFKLPVKRTKDLYHASESVFDNNIVFATNIYKRFEEKEIDHYKGRNNKIRRGSGHFRDYMMKMPYMSPNTITFYLNGNMREIKNILSNLKSLGKKTSYGFGRIKSMNFKETDIDYSLVKDGKAMRAIPLDYVSSGKDICMLPYKPPYWDKGNIRPCVPPYSQVVWNG